VKYKQRMCGSCVCLFKPRYKHTKLFTAEIIFPDDSDSCGMHKGYLRFDRAECSGQSFLFAIQFALGLGLGPGSWLGI